MARNNYKLLSSLKPRLWTAFVVFTTRHSASHRKNGRMAENRSHTKIEKQRHVRNTRAAE